MNCTVKALPFYIPDELLPLPATPSLSRSNKASVSWCTLWKQSFLILRCTEVVLRFHTHEGSVSGALNPVVCPITRCSVPSRVRRQAHGTGKTSTEEKRALAWVPCGSESATVNLTCEDKQFSFCFFFCPSLTLRIM